MLLLQHLFEKVARKYDNMSEPRMKEITDTQIKRATAELVAERKILAVFRRLKPAQRYRLWRMVLAYYGYI